MMFVVKKSHSISLTGDCNKCDSNINNKCIAFNTELNNTECQQFLKQNRSCVYCNNYYNKNCNENVTIVFKNLIPFGNNCNIFRKIEG